MQPASSVRAECAEYAGYAGYAESAEPRVNIVDKTDAEIRAIADPLWRDLVKNSNEGKYGEFAKNFSSSLALAMNQVVAGHQFANSELARSLAQERPACRVLWTQ